MFVDAIRKPSLCQLNWAQACACVWLQLVGEQAFKIARFGRALQEVLGIAHDSATLEMAANALGHLVISGGAVTADLVGSEVGAKTGASAGLSQGYVHWT